MLPYYKSVFISTVFVIRIKNFVFFPLRFEQTLPAWRPDQILRRPSRERRLLRPASTAFALLTPLPCRHNVSAKGSQRHMSMVSGSSDQSRDFRTVTQIWDAPRRYSPVLIAGSSTPGGRWERRHTNYCRSWKNSTRQLQKLNKGMQP